MAWRQWPRITWLKLGDANTRRKKFIRVLSNSVGTYTHHAEKDEAMFQHFTQIIGTAKLATTTFDWNFLRSNQGHENELNQLEQPFSEKEIAAAIK